MDSGNLFAEDPDDVDRVGQQVVELLDLRRLVGHRARPLQLVRGDELEWKNVIRIIIIARRLKSGKKQGMDA